jgi:single stranded DNA-binding protein
MNKINISGRLTRAAELNYSSKGTAMLKINIAVEHSWPIERPKVSFFDVIQFGRRAHDGAELQKGQAVEVIGELEQDRWNDADGNVHSSVHITARVIDKED